MSGSQRLLVVSPVRNEAAHLPAVIDGVVRQRRPPDLWLVVDDHSTDDTLALLREREGEVPFMRVLQAPVQPLPERADRLAAAAEAVAFGWALRQVDAREFDYIGKLDGDIVLDPEHYARLLEEFAREPSLGIAGSALEDPRGRLQKAPAYHVNGALKLYSRECLERIGGMPEQLAWDTIDGTRARMLGFRTHSFGYLRARHLRPTGSVGGQLRGLARLGECVWIMDYPPALVFLRSARLLRSRPPVASGLAYGAGYLRARLRRRPQVADPELRRFSREEQRRRLRAAARRLLAFRR